LLRLTNRVWNRVLRQVLANIRVLDRIIVPSDIDVLLSSLKLLVPTPNPIPQPWEDQEVEIGVNQSLLGFASLNFDHLGLTARFTLTLGPGAAFRIDLVPDKPFKLPQALTGATPIVAGSEKRLTPVDGPDTRVTLKGLAFFRIEGSEAAQASLRFVPFGAEDVVTEITCDPPGFLFGNSGFGLGLPDGAIVLDDSRREGPPPATHAVEPFASDDPTWRGLAIRNAELYFPEGTPLIGRTPSQSTSN
jgi:hypothetical protein